MAAGMAGINASSAAQAILAAVPDAVAGVQLLEQGAHLAALGDEYTNTFYFGRFDDEGALPTAVRDSLTTALAAALNTTADARNLLAT